MIGGPAGVSGSGTRTERNIQDKSECLWGREEGAIRKHVRTSEEHQDRDILRSRGNTAQL